MTSSPHAGDNLVHSHAMSAVSRHIFTWVVLGGALASGACSSNPAAPDAPISVIDAAHAIDAKITTDAVVAPDALIINVDDGAPTRLTCTNTFGTGMNTAHGRLDGILVAVVDPSHHGCSSDSTHVHLQIKSGGAIYDSAVNVDGGFYYTTDITLPTLPWTDGWHANSNFDYTVEGVHSPEFQAANQATITSMLETALTNANHISVYMTGYNSMGAHLVHRKGNNVDGAIILDPLSTPSHAIMFRFDTDVF